MTKPNTQFTPDEVRMLIQMEIETSGLTQTEWAKSTGFAQGFVSSVIRGHQLPGRKMVERMNLREVIYYEPIEGAQ